MPFKNASRGKIFKKKAMLVYTAMLGDERILLLRWGLPCRFMKGLLFCYWT